VNRKLSLILIFGSMALTACSHSAKSQKSFDEIRGLVAGKTATEVKQLLGPPDNVDKLLLGDERWVWWNYTFLEGKKWAPEMRGKVVHLEITFEGPSFEREGREVVAKAEPRVSEPYGVGYVVPGGEEARASSLNNPTRSGV
jgi:hypothetical protein